MSPSVMGDDPDFGAKFRLQEKDMNEIDKKNPNAYPSLLYNAMIQPLIPYAMQGQSGIRVNPTPEREQYQRIFQPDQ